MLIKEILNFLDLDVYLPDVLLDEDLEGIVPKDYIKNPTQYIIRFVDSTFKIIINLVDTDEYCILTDSFNENMRTYVSYTLDGDIYFMN